MYDICIIEKGAIMSIFGKTEFLNKRNEICRLCLIETSSLWGPLKYSQESTRQEGVHVYLTLLPFSKGLNDVTERKRGIKAEKTGVLALPVEDWKHEIIIQGRSVKYFYYIHLQIDIDRYRQIQIDIDRYRQIQIDIDRYRQIQIDIDRYRQIQIDIDIKGGNLSLIFV